MKNQTTVGRGRGGEEHASGKIFLASEVSGRIQPRGGRRGGKKTRSSTKREGPRFIIRKKRETPYSASKNKKKKKDVPCPA